ncbi:MAG TPA: hydroxymethylglutaryl-CoA lyase [Vicinamibacterales bacterium]|nr:hydroxymethylglutaryl-CoA lyase [Vicinamibacterales bacterium]
MNAPFPTAVRLVEVGPRDGLQNESTAVSTDDKVEFVRQLGDAGLPVIEVTAFVNPARVPMMADGAEVFRRLSRRPGVKYMALVPNMRGLERALEARVDAVAVFAAATETFSRRNINQGIAESLDTYGLVSRAALDAGVPVRAYLSTAFGCPYDGPVAPARVAELCERLRELDVFEVALSDTIGVAHPGQVARVLDEVIPRVGAQALALHFHDTRGMAVANVLTGLHHGVSCFDASAGGIGGCPFAPGATGNVATEDLVYMLDGLGIETGVRLPRVIDASTFIATRLDHEPPSRVFQAARRTMAATPPFPEAHDARGG